MLGDIPGFDDSREPRRAIIAARRPISWRCVRRKRVRRRAWQRVAIGPAFNDERDVSNQPARQIEPGQRWRVRYRRTTFASVNVTML